MANVKPEVRPNVTIEDGELRFRNFAGRAGTFNMAGKRNFAVLLPEAVAEQMKADGWNVKYLQPREDGDVEQAYIKVNINFESRQPPQITLVTSRGRTNLGPDEVSNLEFAQIIKADMIIAPWLNQTTGTTSAWLQKLFVTIQEDELEMKYADVISSAQSCIGDECEINPN